MKVNGVKLLLDNYRAELKGYSVDIQDIVRGAILDDVDISPYLESCKDNPFKLDQIRLGLKEGLSEVYYKYSFYTIYNVRTLIKNGVDTSPIESQASNLSNNHMKYLVRWVENGYFISNLDLSVIPESMLNVFEYGLQNGFDMKEFNTGRVYSERFIRACLKIKKLGKSISVLLSDEYTIEVVEMLGSVCSSISSVDRWNSLMYSISPKMSGTKIAALAEITKYGLELARVKDKDEQALGYVLKALKIGVSCLEDIIESNDVVYMESMLQNAQLEKGKTLHGRLRKN